jgi:hypothetical protein
MSSIVVSGDTSGAITVAAPTTAGTSTLTLPSGASGTIAAQGVSTNIVSGTAVASTSGTSINFTGIPSWAKRITVMFNGLSTNGTSTVQIQIGSSSFSTTGYSSNASFGGSNSSWYIFITTGFALDSTLSAATTRNGVYQLSLFNNNTWVGTGTTGSNSGQVCFACAGASPNLSGALDRIRITTVNGTDTFDAGSINILYE